ncbi:MAG: VCBS repeat-containing protein [Bacteroidota bacterium]|nr:VCBS repeat-containing protein [Bacteroidota bacterium]
MIRDLIKTRFIHIAFLILISSCTGNVIQTTVFTDGFQELEPGNRPYFDSSDPAICYDARRGNLGHWTVASSLRQDDFNRAWVIRKEDGENYLAQTFTNLNDKNSPLSLTTHPMIVAGESYWSDYSIEVGFTPQAKFDKCGVIFAYKHTADFYFFGVEGNTVTLKHVMQSVTPLRPIEVTLATQPLVWTPGERLNATVTVRRNKVSTILNDSINMHAEDPDLTGRIGLISDLPAKFHSVEVKLLSGEQRKLSRRKRQLARRSEMHQSDHPALVRWKRFDTGEFGASQNIRLGDLNGDGNKEIVFVRTDAAGSELGSISVINLDGELMWQYGNLVKSDGCSGVELPVQVHDLDGDGSREVIFVRRGRIHILDGKNGKQIKRIRIPGSIDVNSLIFGDLMGVGRDNCILLSDREHKLMALNEKGELLWEQQSTSGSQPMVYDMDKDGRHEVLMGYSVFNPEGELINDVGAHIGDECNGVSVYEMVNGEQVTPCLVYAAGDWGLIYYDFEGNLIKQNILGHVSHLGVADLDMESPGLEVVTSNQWGSKGLAHVMDASGTVIAGFHSESGVFRCQMVNWKGDGEEFFITSADTINGGLFDGAGLLSVAFPADGHPVSYYMATDLMGDARDEIILWDPNELWIYTQEDNPRMGNTYAPRRIPLYNHSMYQMNLSTPGW